MKTVYLIPENQIISEIAGLFKNGLDTDHPDEVETIFIYWCIKKA